MCFLDRTQIFQILPDSHLQPEYIDTLHFVLLYRAAWIWKGGISRETDETRKKHLKLVSVLIHKWPPNFFLQGSATAAVSRKDQLKPF